MIEHALKYSEIVRFKVSRDSSDAPQTQEDIRLAKKYNDRPYLLVLTAQDVKLFGTGAGFARAADGAEGDGQEAVPRPDVLPAFIRRAMWIGPATKLTLDAGLASARTIRRVFRPKRADEAEAEAEAPTSSDDLPADAVSMLVVALSQIKLVRQAGAGVHVAFRRQHPSTRFMGKAVDKAERLLMPWGNNRVKDKEKEHEHDPLLRSCTLSVASEEAAAELVAQLQAARQRLAAAVQWIARSLPLNDRPCVTLVTVQPAGAAAAGTAPAARGAEVLVVAPEWGKGIPVAERWTQEGAAAPPGAGPALCVWLHTPLGPHVAMLSLQQLMECCQPFVQAEAQLLVPSTEPAGAEAATGQLRVLLQARMHREATAERQPDGSGAAQVPLLAVVAVAVAVMSAWLQLVVSMVSATGAVTAMHWAAFLLCNLAAALLLLLLAFQRGKATAAKSKQGAWALQLLQASLVSAAAAEMQQVAAEAGVPAPREAEEAEQGAAAAEDRLLKSFRHLVQQHPDVLDANMAERFFVSYPSSNKAFVALRQCVEWRRQRGMVGLLDQPQPKFEIIKHRYPHAVLGWSKKTDCLVTLDSYGVWKQSYDALKADGVSEDELLRHLMFCFDFNFSVLDSRPLPHGRSINVIDLSGLSMSDAAGDAFRFISKAGALLNLHFPLRLHKAFLINAPSWWSVVWRLVSPLIDSKTRALMCLYSAKDSEGAARAMLEYIDADVLPVEYGGSSEAGLYDSELEQQLWAHVSRVNARQDAPEAEDDVL
ncbi:hypothetical protein D9Q98_000378 [Chlorella vulgaris]|uniref:CRAL-TRIO domain-containing protein n=1 Tax=Chlorella vulgaris TaxID=3077 RepID=A0A9D4Z1I0_CHLVU|nr:hypothetical protein D9Q98_000378 [Chlorella vulgaris]